MTTTLSQYICQLSDIIRNLIKTGDELKCELPCEDYEDTYIVMDWQSAVDAAKKLLGE